MYAFVVQNLRAVFFYSFFYLRDLLIMFILEHASITEIFNVHSQLADFSSS